MIQCSNLSKHYGPQTLFENVSFSIEKNEKIGMVGRNGSGKSTLLKILLGEEQSDSGHVQISKNYSMGALKQHLEFERDTPLEECSQGLPPEEVFQAEKILSGLGFHTEDFQRPIAEFSGGFHLRIQLAKVLIQNPDCLLLDEPTNYLDIVSIRWLQQFLRSYRGEMVLISHDRNFMDRVCTHTMGIHRRTFRKIKGSTHRYDEQIQLEEQTYEKNRTNQEKKVREMRNYIDRFRSSARRASQAQSRVKQLEKMEEMLALNYQPDLKIQFHYRPTHAKNLVKFQEGSFSYLPSPQKKDFLFEGLSFELNPGDRLAIIGANGKGKSTLLNILSQDLSLTQGNLDFHPDVSIGHFGQTNINRLDLRKSIVDEILSSNSSLLRQEAMNICGAMLFSGEMALKPIEVLSGGERSRVLLGKILGQSANLILLDEPTNHLDQDSVDALLQGIQKFQGVMVMITHSEYILEQFANKMIVFLEDEVRYVEGGYSYFLQSVGWDGEARDMEEKPVPSLESSQSKVSPNPELNKKEIRKKRASIIQLRSQKTSPLKKKIKEFESRITKLENQHHQLNDQLLEAVNQKESQKIQDLSTEVAQVEKKVNELYDRLSETTEECETFEADFQQQLDELES